MNIAGVTYFTTSNQGLKLITLLLSADSPGSALRSSITAWAWLAAEYSANAPKIPEARRISAKAWTVQPPFSAIAGVAIAANAKSPVGAS